MADSQTLETLAVDLETQGVQVDKETGDVTFDATAVDKRKRANRKGFIFDWDRPEDVDVTAFRANPIMPYMHESFSFPAGVWTEITVTNKAVKVKGLIPDLSDDPDLADFDREFLRPIRGAIRKKMLRMVSIGFYITEWEEEEDGRVIRVKKFEIVEISLVWIG